MTYSMEDDLEDRRILDAHYKGDTTREEAENEYGLAIALGWSDIVTCVGVYPQHEQRAKDAIAQMLGYLPHPNIIIPHEVFVRTLIEQHAVGMISDKDYQRELVTHITHIRNDDMNKLGWIGKRNLTTEEYRRYSNTLTDYKNRVTDKVAAFFGEVPELVYSLQAEMMVRQAMYMHPWANIPEVTPFDYRAFTIIAYRKSYLDHGAPAANQSPLMGRRSS
ncbi:MAG: hypothetical protein IPJ76_01435 [Flavobacteriales bacterium]|nr:MAG: hypothetical protein IPJ76_01435 [Flavobacteriales bacterium]